MSNSLRTNGMWTVIRSTSGAAADDFTAGQDPNTNPAVPAANLVQSGGYQTMLVFWTGSNLTPATDSLSLRVWHLAGGLTAGTWVAGAEVSALPPRQAAVIQVYGSGQFFVEIGDATVAGATNVRVEAMGALLGG